jgi:hypothetical protein
VVFERFAGDIVVHCKTRRQAERVAAAIAGLRAMWIHRRTTWTLSELARIRGSPDRAVTGLSSQPFRLLWDAANGVRRRHVPDFFARLADGTGVVVDVRADDRIGPRDAVIVPAQPPHLATLSTIRRPCGSDSHRGGHWFDPSIAHQVI